MAREDSQPCVRLRAPFSLICDAKQVQGDENLNCVTNRVPSKAIFELEALFNLWQVQAPAKLPQKSPEAVHAGGETCGCGLFETRPQLATVASADLRHLLQRS